MRILKIAGVLVVLFVIASMNAFGCSCETYGVPRKDAKEYYTKKFDGAIFLGTVASIKHDPKSNEGGITFSELTVNVSQYWRGVTKPTFALLVAGPNTSCWFDWKVGEESFFIVDENRYLSICELANWKPSDSKSPITEYTTELLGKSKSFTKPK